MRKGFKAGIPIVIGYFPVAMAFGILAKSNGFTLLEVFSFSFILFAGASQFIGISMIGLGAGFGEIILATFLLNFRHFFMSASLVEKMGHILTVLKPILGFFVTDEVFSVASFTDDELTPSYLFGLEIVSYSSWGIGTIVGYLVGNVLPPMLQISMGIGLYALFVSILVPEMKKSYQAVVLAGLAGALNTVARYLFKMPQGWSIILVIVITSTLGVVMFGKEVADE